MDLAILLLIVVILPMALFCGTMGTLKKIFKATNGMTFPKWHRK